ncbi:MAG: response regulator [Deltaproteobacteria bacterium]|nr:response regulator [Deltaproteobacteria bacterium]
MAKILVLDDETDACDLIERILSSGHDVTTFTEEQEAIDFAGRAPVDLAILDIKLKTMSGVDVLERLKQDNPHMKAIMLTGYPTVETARRSLTLGAHEYLVKPIDIDELEQKVKKVLTTQKKKSKGPIYLEK